MRRLIPRAAVLAALLPAFAIAQGHPGRPDAPARPQKGEYVWAEPKDWTPPTLEELQKWDWKDGWVTTARKLAAERHAGTTPLATEQEALTMKNDSKEANAKILSVLSRPPKDDAEVDWDATINRVADGAPATLNYVLYSSRYEVNICTLIYPGVFSFNHELKPLADGDFVQQWKTNPVADMVILRDDVAWEDGTPYTAFDVEFSYHVILDQRINVPAVRSGVDELKWVKAYDARTLVFFHKEPRVTNIWNVNFPSLPKHIFSPGLAEDPTLRSSEWNVYWNLNPLAGGPYRLKEHQTHQFVLLERREDFYQDKNGKPLRDKPYAKFIRFRILEEENSKLLAFKKGEVDEVWLNANQWAGETDDVNFDKHGVKVKGTEWSYRYIGWNLRPIPDAPFFKDKRVRRAMSYALNHKELLEELSHGLYDAGAGIFHPQSWMASPQVQPFQQDLDKAESLLEEAGWIDTDKDGVRDQTVEGKKWNFEFTSYFAQGSPVEQALVLLKEDLDSIGVRMNLKALEFATLQQHVHEHRFQAQAAGWGSGADPDTNKNLWETAAYDNGRNYVGYSNAEVDRLFEEGAKEFDFEKRSKIYQRIHEILWEDQPYTWLYYQSSLYGFNKRLRGYNFSPRNPYSYNPGFLSVWVPKAP